MRPPEDLRKARVTVGIAAATVVAFLLSMFWPFEPLVLGAGFIPVRVEGGTWPGLPVWLTPLSATLLHLGVFHLLFNLIFLLVCGRSVEPVLGARGLAILYVAGAYGAAAAAWAAVPDSQSPVVGASGAVSAVVGAYSMLFGRYRVKVRSNALAVAINALWLAAAWVGLQVLLALGAGSGAPLLTVAAHVGGFVAGLLLARPLLMLKWRGA
jgi:membrane associated rhomboid family serine protease